MRAEIMGILNVTPDSFSDGGMWIDADRAIAHGLEMFDEGASIVDVGGESSRPGSTELSVDEECARVLGVVRRLAAHGRVSIDTRHREVAEQAVAAGASIVNDISSSLDDVAAKYNVGWIPVHMQGEPGTMQANPSYENVVEEVADFLNEKAKTAAEKGVSEIWVDPGIGFGKTVAHNLELLKQLSVLVGNGVPVALGVSRKSFLGEVTTFRGHKPSAADRLEGSLVVAAHAQRLGAKLIRVHDVAAHRRALAVAEQLDSQRTSDERP